MEMKKEMRCKIKSIKEIEELGLADNKFFLWPDGDEFLSRNGSFEKDIHEDIVWVLAEDSFLQNGVQSVSIYTRESRKRKYRIWNNVPIDYLEFLPQDKYPEYYI
jgi:hypothetical protein